MPIEFHLYINILGFDLVNWIEKNTDVSDHGKEWSFLMFLLHYNKYTAKARGYQFICFQF